MHLALALLLLQPPQEPAAALVIARCTLRGKETAITRGDVALEMAFHLRRKDEGRAACEHLVNTALVRAEAAAKKLMPSRDEARRYWEQKKAQMRAQGHRPEDFPAVRNAGDDGMVEIMGIQLAHEQLVRAALDLRADEPPSPDMLKLWLQDARKRHPVVDDPDQLPLGTAVRVDGADLPLLELGMLLLGTSDVAEQDRFVRQVVVLQGLETMAKEHGLTATDADLKQELEVRRAMAEVDPRFQGMSFEQLLKTQGLSPEWLLQSRVFRAQVLQKKLAARLHPRAELLAEIARDRQTVLDRAGPRRRLAVIFARALAEPNELVPRDFAAATKHLQQVKERLGKEPFATVARIESDDPAGKLRGGDLGWFQRAAKNLPEPVLAAAFALEADAVSAPIQGPDGCYLVKVLGIEPALSDDQLVDRMREQFAEALTQQVLAEAKITRADGTPLDGGLNNSEPSGGAVPAPGNRNRK